MSTARLTQFLGSLPACGRALRWWANRFEEGSVVRIRQGYAAGYLWKRHHRYVNGYWIGHYELAIQKAIVGQLQPGSVFFDVGANAGFYTLVGARVVGPKGKCVAFDPSAENIESIREQLELNRLDYCQAVPEAIGEREEVARFCFAKPGAATAHIGKPWDGEKEVGVQMTTLDRAAGRFGAPSLVKIDIEGAEVRALQGADRLLHEVKPRWLIELHGNECAEGVEAILGAAGYELFGLDGVRLSGHQRLPQHITARPGGEKN